MGPNGIFGPTVQANPTEGPQGPQNGPKRHLWANGTSKSHLGPPRAPEAREWALGLTVRAYPITGPQGPQRPRVGPTSICGQTVQANLVRGLPTRRRYPQKATHMLAEASGAKNLVFGRGIVEVRSPDLWGVPFDAEFHARFAHEGPKAARTQFRG